MKNTIKTFKSKILVACGIFTLSFCCQQHRLAVQGEEAQSLRGHILLDCLAEITGIDIVHIAGIGRVGHIVDHNTADALQCNKRIGAAADLTHGNGFRFRALLRAAIVNIRIVVGAVEPAGKIDGSLCLKIIPALVDQLDRKSVV